MAQKVCKLQKSDGKDVGLNKITINLYENGTVNIQIENDHIPINCISEKTLNENR